MNVLCTIKASAGLPAGVGRSLCRRRPVSVPASAGLSAGVGRSLCRPRPVSVPASAGLYAGIGQSLCRRRPVSMPYVNIMDVLCIIKHYVNIPVTVLVLLNIILTSRSLSWSF